MVDKYHSDTQEKIETITYYPNLQHTGDLEAGTKTITATSEASGLENADYSKALTLAKPDDARLEVKRIAARLAVTIDGFDAATHLYCRVYVDAQDANHRLFDEDWAGIGEKLDAVDTHSGNKATIFNLLKDGSEHTFYFFFWIDQANNAVISVAQLWEAVGTHATGSNRLLDITHTGLMSIGGYFKRQATGAQTIKVFADEVGEHSYIWYKISSDSIDIKHAECCFISKATSFLTGTMTTATELSYIDKIKAILRNLC